MTCKRCEELSVQLDVKPEKLCVCDHELDETERAIRTLARKPSPEASRFYEMVRAGAKPSSSEAALDKIITILKSYQNKEREFITFDELQRICSEGKRSA